MKKTLTEIVQEAVAGNTKLPEGEMVKSDLPLVPGI